ncbi:MAG TPA: PEP-CTERM sorting domain-containing protein [Phycisphaerae bacterium]|jgi:hypothetical protein
MNEQLLKKRRMRRILWTVGITYTALVSLFVWEYWPARPFVGPSYYAHALFNIKATSVTSTDETAVADIPSGPSVAHTSSPTSVPEPGTLLLVAPALVMLARRKQKFRRAVL